MIAYFPQAWHWDRTSPLLRTCFHDVPWEEPGLVRDLLRLPWPDRSILARVSSSLRHLTFQDRKARGGDFAAALPDREIESEAKSTTPSSRQAPVDNGLGGDELKPSCVVTLRRDGGKHPLFLIHGVDGRVNCFYGLLRHLERDRPVYGILSQGLLRERVALTRLEQLVAYYLEQVQQVQPHGPYHFVGYSFGGYVAFEMARQLHSRREFAGMVGIIDVMPMRAGLAPGLLLGVSRGDSAKPSPRRSAIAFQSKRLFSSGGLNYVREKLRARVMRTIYTLMASANQPIPPFLQRAYDLNWFAAVRYAPQSFPGKITLFQTAALGGEQHATNDLWARVAGQGIELRQILGNHETIFEEPQVRSLAKEVIDWLAAE